MGRLSICFASTVLEMSAVAVLTTGVSPSTVIVSERPPTSSETSSFTVSLTFSTMPLLLTVLKPESTTSTLYLPIGRKSSRYAPTSSVGTVRLKPVSTFLAVTVTPGRAPPLESVMVPTIAAEVTWAPAEGARARAIRTATHEMRNIDFLVTAHPSNEDPGGTGCRSGIFVSRRDNIPAVKACQVLPERSASR